MDLSFDHPRQASEPSSDQPLVLPKTRAVLFSGPLGSGKTTTLNQILSTAQNTAGIGNYIIIENDIGSANTDKQRLNASPEQILALTAGCICCNDLHSLKAAVKEIASSTGKFHTDTIFIETTGIADPHAVKEALHELNIPALLIVTVDVLHFERNRLLRRDRAMIAPADILAFTWWDCPGGEAILPKVLETVSVENPDARKVFLDRHGRLQNEGEDIFNIVIGASANTSEESHQAVPLNSRQETHAFEPLPALSGRRHRHPEYVSTITLKSGLSPDDIVSELSRICPDELIRVKGTCGGSSIDCTHGDWNIAPSQIRGNRDLLTIISTKPVLSGDLTRLAQPQGSIERSIDLSDFSVRDATISLVSELIRQIPEQVAVGGRLITECDAGEAWLYISAAGFPEDLRNQFLARLASFYIAQFEALQSGQFNDHPSLPYYKREVGQNLSWLLIDCSDLLTEWGLKDLIENYNPWSLYFDGLKEATSPLHVGSIRDKDIPYFKARIDGLSCKIGSCEQAIQVAATAVTNVLRLNIDGSWKKAESVLTDLADGLA